MRKKKESKPKDISGNPSENRKQSFSRDTFELARGAGIAQLILLAFAPVFTRIFSSMDFGVYGIFTSVVVVVAAAATLRYELAIVLPRRHRDGGLLLILSGVCAAVVSLTFLFVALAAFKSGVLRWAPGIFMTATDGRVTLLLLWGALFVFTAGVTQALIYWNTRSKRFRDIALSRIIRSAGTVFFSVSGGICFSGPAGLIGGYVLGQISGALYLAKISAEDILKYLKGNLRNKRIMVLARRYSSYPRHNLPMGIMYSLTQYLPVPIIAKLFGVDKAGYWMLTYRVLYAPAILLGQAVMQTFYQRSSERFNSGEEIHGFYARITLAMALIGLAPCIIVFFAGPYLFRVLFGEAWGVSGAYARWLVLYMYVWFTATPSIMLTHVYGKQFFLMVVQGLLLLSCAVSFLGIAALKGGGTAGVAVYSLAGAAISIFIIFKVWGMSKKIYTEKAGGN
jgi:lipopolysaccharide exporter